MQNIQWITQTLLLSFILSFVITNAESISIDSDKDNTSPPSPAFSSAFSSASSLASTSSSSSSSSSSTSLKDITLQRLLLLDNSLEINSQSTWFPTATSSLSHTRTAQLSYAASATPSTRANVTSSQSNNTVGALVQYQFSCTLDKVFCGKVKDAVDSAINTFTQVVTIKNNMTIWISYYNFCDKKCNNGTYGWGAPTSQFTLPFFDDGADLNYVYPQALAKQLAPYSNTSVWADHDVDIEINHDAYMAAVDFDKAQSEGWNASSTNSNTSSNVPPGGKYWFFNDTAAIQQHQIDVRYIVLHELLHGLGFISAWAAYFWTDASPFRTLVDGFIDATDLQIVTPGPYWYVNQDTGPAFITGFQPTMIFDKFLVSVIENNDTSTTSINSSSSSGSGSSGSGITGNSTAGDNENTNDASGDNNPLNITTINGVSHANLSTIGFDMQNFCVQDSDAFIINFVRQFNRSSQAKNARKLWNSMSQPRTLRFDFFGPLIANSSFNTDPYLKQTYQNMTLLTGSNVLSSQSEQFDRTNNRPGISISHVDDQYASTPDFLMTRHYITGQTLEELVSEMYDRLPVIRYNTTLNNGTLVSQVYRSPIGPGILRILDSLGYSTVLTKSNYTTDGAVKTYKSKSVCDDSNNNHALTKVTPVTSAGTGLVSLLVCSTTSWFNPAAHFYYLLVIIVSMSII